MKRTSIIRSIFAAVAVAAISAWAETETVGGYTWRYRVDGEPYFDVCDVIAQIPRWIT